MNRSPWLHQLNRKRSATPLATSVSTDVAVVGAGIAGISTSYFLLRDSDKRVVLVDADRVAHGATGHNGGQLVAEFERPLASLVREYGLERAGQAHRDVEGAWRLLEEIRQEANITTPFWRFTGYGGLSDMQQVREHLENNLLREQVGLPIYQMMIAAEWQPGATITAHLEHLFSWVPQVNILELLETSDTRYIALVADQRGCMNSALFCEELVQVMLAQYPERFSLYEETPISQVSLGQGTSVLKTDQHTITAQRVVLCTNGFEKLRIINEAGPNIDTRFHHDIEGKVGYMAAYVEPQDKPPAANYYLDQPGTDPDDPYFYLTRRPYDIADQNDRSNLISIGGPERDHAEADAYTRNLPYLEGAQHDIEAFMERTYKYWDPKRTRDAFFWHGLMGYTPNRMRLIGSEPCNPTLMYNLGCNGIGLIPSLFGGWKIGQLIAGKRFPISIFDPQDRTCPPATL